MQNAPRWIHAYLEQPFEVQMGFSSRLLEYRLMIGNQYPPCTLADDPEKITSLFYKCMYLKRIKLNFHILHLECQKGQCLPFHDD